jgi:hypothetical protein
LEALSVFAQHDRITAIEDQTHDASFFKKDYCLSLDKRFNETLKGCPALRIWIVSCMIHLLD